MYMYLLMFRAVEDKNIGPLIKTIMTRCIHCTRCIRYDNLQIRTVHAIPVLMTNCTRIYMYRYMFFVGEIQANKIIMFCEVVRQNVR